MIFAADWTQRFGVMHKALKWAGPWQHGCEHTRRVQPADLGAFPLAALSRTPLDSKGLMGCAEENRALVIASQRQPDSPRVSARTRLSTEASGPRYGCRGSRTGLETERFRKLKATACVFP